jgi:hypothetical protein
VEMMVRDMPSSIFRTIISTAMMASWSTTPSSQWR